MGCLYGRGGRKDAATKDSEGDCIGDVGCLRRAHGDAIARYTPPVVRERLPALLLASLPAFSATAEAGPPVPEVDPVEPDGRFPIWPSEVDRIAAPLRDPASATETVRVAALDELRQFATSVIMPEIDLALTDPSPEVRRLALELCTSRRILACVPAAEKMWEEGEGSVRMMALQLLSQDPSEQHLALLYEAMRDPNDLMREHAIMLLVDSPLSDEQAEQARQEIVAQLGDVSARVRRTAARSLGRLGPGEGGPALVRLLDDIDPQVAEAAAYGLGQLEDPRTAPALRRALETPINPTFANEAVNALARLPGEDIDEALLQLFDSPPRNVRRTDVATAIGRRASPSDELIAGLVDRIRDADLREPAIQSLLWLGDLAVPELERALARGLEPDIGLEVERLLAARKLEPTPSEVVAGMAAATKPVAPLPAANQREAWFERLREHDGIDAAAELARLHPEWLSGALAWQLRRGSTPEQVLPWLTILALARDSMLDDDDDAVIWGLVAGWASDAGLGGEGRCVATLALGSAVMGRHAELAEAELVRLTSAALDEVRGCAALALARHGNDPALEGLLADPSPQVRAMAALAHRSLPRIDARVRARLALQGDRDSEALARTSARLVLTQPAERARWTLLRGRASTSVLFGDQSPHWQRFDLDGEPVDVPMFGSDDRLWAIVPLEGAVVREQPAPPVLVAPSPYGGYPHYGPYY